MSKQQDFIQQHVVDGQMTAEQAAQLLELGEGDTGDMSESGGAPVTAEQGEQATDEVSKAQGDAAPDDGETPVLMAKDGKHTIPYEKLVEARTEGQTWKEKATAALDEIEQLKGQLQARTEGAPQTKAEQQLEIAEAAIEAGVDPDLFGDFSEEAIAKGVQTLVDRRVKVLVDEALKPLQQREEVDARTAHFNAIEQAHPDFESVVESRELANWIDQQPSFAKQAIQQVMKAGTASDVIEMLDAFKASAGKSAPSKAPGDVQAAAKAAVSKAASAAPVSLSDIPGGRVGATNAADALAQKNPLEMAEVMANMSPEQIESFLNRNG